MKTPRIYIGALAVFCIAALVIGSAGASAMMQKGTGYLSKNTSGKGPMHSEANEERMSQLLTNLTAKGYDVSAIRTSVVGGDLETAMTLLKEFMTAHPEAFPAIGEGSGKGPMKGVANETRMLEMLDNLTAKGYDVSAISAAVTSGDYKTAATLLKEFMTAHPEAFPAIGEGSGKGPMKGVANETRMLEMLDNLTAKGYDVSAISAAVTSGDYKTAATLLKEFMTAHPEAFPAIGEGSGKGPMKGVANETRMLEMLDNLTAKGYDVSAISAAVTSGDLETAMTLLKEFMTANPDARPARDDGNISGQRRAKNT